MDIALDLLVVISALILFGLSIYYIGSKVYNYVFFYITAAKAYKKSVAFQNEPSLLFIDHSNTTSREHILYASLDKILIFDPKNLKQIKVIQYSEINKIVIRLNDWSTKYRKLKFVKHSAEDIYCLRFYCSDKKKYLYEFVLSSGYLGWPKNKYALTHGHFFTKLSEHVKNIEVI